MITKILRYFIFLLLPGFLFAQTEEDVIKPFIGIPGVGARASGLGEAYTGVGDDFSAMHYNPAGLAHITWAELSVGGTYFSLDNTFTTNLNQKMTGTTNRNYYHTNSIGYVWPVYGIKFSVGVGYNNVAITDRAFQIQYQDSTEYTTEESSLGAYTISGGYQLRKELSVGIGLHLYRGNNTYSSQTYVPSGSNSTYEIDSDYSGVGLTVGILWAPTDYLRTGLAFKTPKYLDVDETYNSSIRGEVYNWHGNYQIQSPPEFRLGQSVNMGPVLVSGSLIWKDWANSRMSTDIPGENGLPIDIQVNYDIREQFTSVLEYAVGGEVLIPGINSKIRTGIHHIPGYREDGSVSDKTVFSGGASIVLAQQFKIDWSVNRTNWEEDYNEIESAEITNTWSTVNFSYRF